jgi:hypothetical protein
VEDMNMKNPYIRKRRIHSLKVFLKGVPDITDYITDKYPDRASDECTEFVVDIYRYRLRRRNYFRRYWFWYLIARLLNRKEVK